MTRKSIQYRQAMRYYYNRVRINGKLQWVLKEDWWDTERK